MAAKHLFQTSSIALTLACALGIGAPASAQTPRDPAADLKRAREALERYKDPVAAIHDGYFSTLGCVTYPKPGAAGQVPYAAGGMGVHFFNGALMGAPLDPTKPQVLVYEPGAGGKLQLVAAEWFVPLTPELKGRPELFGRPFDGPMEGHHPLMPHGLHHYDLHVWLWKDNPVGMFAPTNPKIKCPKGPYTFEETAPKIVPHK